MPHSDKFTALITAFFFLKRRVTTEEDNTYETLNYRHIFRYHNLTNYKNFIIADFDEHEMRQGRHTI